MYDLMLTPNGDLAFEVSEQLKDSLQINFVTSKTNALTINFHIDNLIDNEIGNGLAINFKVHKPLNNKTCREAIGQDYYEQCIRLRLESTIGTIKGNETIGSKLELYKHNYIDNSSLEYNVKTCVKEAIKDILPNATITIDKIKTQYLDYYNSYVITIIDQDKYYEYYL
ncbi:MAG: hypothetical protein ACRDB0_06575 [Paraclostridium sp.]